MTTSIYYLPFVLLSTLGESGLKPTPPLLKSVEVATLQVDTQSLVVSGVNKSTSTLFIGGQSYNFDNPVKYTHAQLNSEENIWELYLEINDTSRIGTSATTINITGQWMYGGEIREYTLRFPYNNPTSSFFSFGIVVNYGDPQQPQGAGYYWDIDTISVSNTTPIQWNYDVIDIPSLIFTIFTLPFTFITKAFDFTIFKGTPYQVDFGSLAMIVFGGLTFITLLGFILKGIKR